MMLCLFLSMLAAGPQVDDIPDSLPPYFMTFIQTRTLFANDEDVRLVIRVGNQRDRTLRPRKFPDLIKGLQVFQGDEALPMSENFSSDAFYDSIKSLRYGAHRDFRLNLMRYFPDMAKGGVFRAEYHGPHYDLVSENIKVVPIPLPDLNAQFVLRTSMGDITIELEPDQVPNHAANFAILAKTAFYQNMLFHRVKPDFVIQTGDPLGNGQGGSGYPLYLEVSPFLRHKKYNVGMARKGDDRQSATSQFYICLDDVEMLDGDYTIFGKVVDGFDVVDRIGSVPTTGPNGSPADRPLTDVELRTVIIKPAATEP